MLLEADKEHQREKAKLRQQIEELSLALAKQQHGAEARTAASRAAAAHQRATKAGGYGAGVASWGSGNEPAGATDAGGGSRFWNAGSAELSAPTLPLPLGRGWVEMRDDEGTVYYQNDVMQVTQWGRPESTGSQSSSSAQRPRQRSRGGWLDQKVSERRGSSAVDVAEGVPMMMGRVIMACPTCTLENAAGAIQCAACGAHL